MSTETAMMLAWPEGRLPSPEAEPVTDLYLEWIAGLTKDKRVCEDVLKTDPDIPQRRAAGTRYIAICDRLDELARREAERKNSRD